MTQRSEPRPGDELTPRIGRVATRSLAAHGCSTYADVACRSRRELSAMHGVGPKAIGILDEELRTRGLTFLRD
jgi:predicted flap endonuclease-1-like 5' DNA nuclease